MNKNANETTKNPRHNLQATGCMGCLVLTIPPIITALAAAAATYIFTK